MAHNFLSSNPADLARSLLQQNRDMQEREAQAQAKTLNLPYINLQGFPLDLAVMSYFTEAEARQSQSIPFFRDGHDVRIGTHNPGNQLLQEKVKELGQKYKVALYYISAASLESTLKFYSKVARPAAISGHLVQVNDSTPLPSLLDKIKSGQAASLGELIEALFGAAVQMNASDMHLEPEEHLTKLRYRIDGVLQDIARLDKDVGKKITSRLKILAKLKLNVENVPQDGRLTFYYGARPVDVRVSLLPSGSGEAVVLRLLGVGATNLKLAQLGLRGRAYQIVEQQLAKPNGMIISTGPTGSGKTTTLYAFLNELNEPGVKIITLEDPIEYKLEGIQQTPIDYRVDFSFVKGLRAILRQDPDIVMVGEIRDPETAETALQAALTGHVVLSTLHTNDSSGAVPRLVTMGVKPFVIAPALNAIIAQRLVRRLCQACKQPTQLTAELMTRVQKVLTEIVPAAEVTLPETLQFYHSTGCAECHNLGYQGRIGIYEVMEVNDSVKELILANVSSLKLRAQAFQDGMVTMVQDGLLKALEGITDVEEVFRVAGE
jgi:type II secretory ATPase GspE/PulE/Tfp pilus assembly ATPase PilB-like protein